MARFRIFTNDRGAENGIPMYSALRDVDAKNATAAETMRMWPTNPGGVGAKAIEWPVETEESRKWQAKHVGDGL